MDVINKEVCAFLEQVLSYDRPVVIDAQTAHRIIGADGNHHLCISNTEQQSMLVSCLMVFFSFPLFLYNI